MIKFLFSKFISKIQIPSIKNCDLDKNTKIFQGCSIYNSKIDSYTYIGPFSQVNYTTIGKFCSISGNVKIGGGMHPLNYVSTSPIFLSGKNAFKTNFSNHNFNPYLQTIIGNDVWIGEGAYLKGGIKVSDGAVIGMGSVVTHDVGPYEVWAGNPARMIRKRFNDDEIKILLKYKWWSKSVDEIINESKDFNDISKYIINQKRGEV